MNEAAGRKGPNESGPPRNAPIGRAPTGAQRGQRLVALFALALLLFNFPLLALWEGDTLVLGVPLFPVALFVIWAVLIGLLAWIVERHDV